MISLSLRDRLIAYLSSYQSEMTSFSLVGSIIIAGTMTKTMLSSDIMLAYNQLLANMTKPVLLPDQNNNTSSTSESYHSCFLCGATFTDTKSLAKHELTHNQNKRKHECKECGKRFNSSSDLKRHSLIHTNTRPYKCHLCPTAFVQQAHLTRHLKSHTRHGVRFKCLGCGTMFLHSTNVRWHQQYCEEAQGSNGGYVVTQSEGEGLDTIDQKKKPTLPVDPTKPTNNWSRENKIYYFDGPFSSRHSSSSDNETGSSGSTDGGSEGSTSFLNSNKLVYFDGPYDKSELLVRNKPAAAPRPTPTTSAHLTASQLSYLNSRISMVGPKSLKHTPAAADLPAASTEDILKVLAKLQAGGGSDQQTTEQQQETRNLSPYMSAGGAGVSAVDASSAQKSSPPSQSPSYKIVPNKIIQHNVTPPRPLATSPQHHVTPSPQHHVTSPPQHHVTSSPDPTNQTEDDKINSILELVRKLVAEGLRSPTAELILSTISRRLENMASSSCPPPPPASEKTAHKKRKLSEPTQGLLNSNLLTTQNILANNLTPLLQSHFNNRASSTYNPLSFTPLLFRQFPALSHSSSLLSQFACTPNFKSTTSLTSGSFADQLRHLAAAAPLSRDTSRDTDAANDHQIPTEVKQECVSPGHAATPTVILPAAPSPLPTGTVATSEVRKHCSPLLDASVAEQEQRNVSPSRKTPEPMTTEDSLARDVNQPISMETAASPRDTAGPMETEQRAAVLKEEQHEMEEDGEDSPGEKSPVAAGDLNSNMETSRNIAFHRLQDLLSLV